MWHLVGTAVSLMLLWPAAAAAPTARCAADTAASCPEGPQALQEGGVALLQRLAARRGRRQAPATPEDFHTLTIIPERRVETAQEERAETTAEQDKAAPREKDDGSASKAKDSKSERREEPKEQHKEEPREAKSEEPAKVEESGRAETVASNEGLGNIAAVEDGGLKAVSKLGSMQENERFVRRAVRKAGLLIEDEARLRKFVEGLFDGSNPRDFKHLSHEIASAATGDRPWVCVVRPEAEGAGDEAFAAVARPQRGPGLAEPLNEEGYAAVAKLKKDSEMNVFVHRVLNHLQLQVKDRSGVLGLIPWFDGTSATQTYAALTKELLAIAVQPGAWVAVHESKG